MAKRKKNARRRRVNPPEIPGTGRKEIPADLTKHVPQNVFGYVPAVYVDEEYICGGCGKPSVWTAEDQKWYYETAKGRVFARHSRCDACRKAMSDSHAGTPKKTARQRWEDRQRRLRNEEP